VALLASLLRRGKAILIVASDNADAVNLKLLLEAAGPSLRLPVEFQPPSPGQDRRNLLLTAKRHEQGPFSVFGDNLAALVSPLRFSGALTSKKVAGALEDDVLATYGDGTAFLVVSGSEGSSLAVVNADLEHSNLPASPMFVPLMGELTRQLLSKKEGAVELASGEPVAVSLPGEGEHVGELAISANPPDKDSAGELVQESFGIQWRSKAAGKPGVYEVKRAGQTLFGAAATIPASESDLRSLSADVFEGRLAGERKIQFQAYSAGAPEKQDYLWVWLALGCLGCVLAEIVALRFFRM
jgi:hypothetical protein